MGSESLKIGFDVDGVLADFTSKYIQIGNAMFGFPDPKTYVQPSWDFTCYTESENEKIWHRIQEIPNFWLTLPPLPQINKINDLWKDIRNVVLFFITSRVPTLGHSVEAQTSAWLEDHTSLYKPMVICAPSYRKAHLIHALEIDYFIDDKVETVADILYLTKCAVFLKDASYNQSPNPQLTGVPRVLYVNNYIERIYERKKI